MPAPAVLFVGFHNNTLIDKVVAPRSSDPAPVRRTPQSMRKEGNLIDATQGRRNSGPKSNLIDPCRMGLSTVNCRKREVAH
jgi:regulator of extracellular matrix RemA (YlzA/DUF370 family)